jgi:DNA-binding transcriptional LysR family regulator
MLRPLEYRRMFAEPLIAAVPEAWILEGHLTLFDDRIPTSVLIEGPAIGFPSHIAPALHGLVTTFYAAHDGSARIVQHTIQMQTIISLISAGMGIALGPASLRHLARTGVHYLNLVEPAPILETGLVWRRADSTPTLSRFLDVAAKDRCSPSSELREWTTVQPRLEWRARVADCLSSLSISAA